MKFVRPNPDGMSKEIIDPTAHFNQETFEFGKKIILPKEAAERLRVIRDIVYGSSKDSKNQRHIRNGEAEVGLYMRIAEKLEEYKENGLIKNVTVSNVISSKGGHYDSRSARATNKRVKVNYFALYVDGTLILEPIGQKNNMTYIADVSKSALDRNETIKGYKGVDEYLKLHGRKQARRDKVLFGVMHTPNSVDSGYNYEQGDILDIIYMASHGREDFFKALEQTRTNGNRVGTYCGVKRLFSLYTAMQVARQNNLSKDEVLPKQEDKLVIPETEGVEHR